ncbi:uncharacterized protein LODBEIA_P37580 [Lodderomyces beijingensis]|uniref:HORMA domain-containing protein n=1 Tax=Lodderomyces beijingensis TaxID=1775926 RepID=A0ABP0ZN31_9ASCO
MLRKKSHTDETKPLTINNFLIVFHEFLIAWLNSILYCNKIYDPLVFDEHKAFDLLFYKNRHPYLDKFITDLVLNIINNLIISKKQPNGLQRVSCAIYDTRNGVVKRSYAVNFSHFVMSLHETITELRVDAEEIDASASLEVSGLFWSEIYAQFQSILFRHLQELKKRTTVAGTRHIDDEEEEETSMSKPGNQNEGEDDLFFQITVDLDSGIYPRNEDWVRLSSNDHDHDHDHDHDKSDDDDDDDSLSPTVKVLGNLSLSVLCFDLVNKYYED